MKDFEIECEITLDCTEDGGEAMMAESIPFFTSNSDEDSGIFLILKSYDETRKHKDLVSLLNKKVKITIEIL